MIDLKTFSELFFEEEIFGEGVVVIEGALDGEAEFVELERFLQIIVGPFFHRFEGRLDGAETGDDDDDGWGMEGAGFLKDFQAVRASFVEVKIADDQFRLDGLDALDGGIVIVEGEHIVPLGAQKLGHHLHHGDFVINNQHFGHGPKLRRITQWGKILSGFPCRAFVGAH